jgi:hypothetical protein
MAAPAPADFFTENGGDYGGAPAENGHAGPVRMAATLHARGTQNDSASRGLDGSEDPPLMLWQAQQAPARQQRHSAASVAFLQQALPE